MFSPSWFLISKWYVYKISSYAICIANSHSALKKSREVVRIFWWNFSVFFHSYKSKKNFPFRKLWFIRYFRYISQSIEPYRATTASKNPNNETRKKNKEIVYEINLAVSFFIWFWGFFCCCLVVYNRDSWRF